MLHLETFVSYYVTVINICNLPRSLWESHLFPFIFTIDQLSQQRKALALPRRTGNSKDVECRNETKPKRFPNIA